jgi:hypothetical protein
VPPRDRADAPRKTPRVRVPEEGRFLNRDDERRQVLTAISRAVESPGDLAVFELVGPGGVGKSRLLRELRDSASELAPSPSRVVRVTLGAEAATPGGPLTVIRRNAGTDCLLFDAALLIYRQEMGQPLQLDSGALSNSLVVRAAERLGWAYGVPLPLSFGIDLFAYARSKWAAASRYEPEEFEAIDLLRDRPEELERRLPEFLAFDIARALGPEEALFAFYDDYEKQRDSTLAKGSPWLRMFIKSLGSGVHVISGREPLSWDGEPWVDVRAVTLGPLPERHSRELIRAQASEDLADPVVERMLEKSRCLPFFLEAIVNGVPEDGAKHVRPEDLDDPVGFLLAHREKSERRLMEALATIQVFDRELFESLVRGLHLRPDFLEFDDLLPGFYVEPLPAPLHKTHDLLTGFVRDGAAQGDISRRALEVVTADLPGRCARNGLDDTEALLPIFVAITTGWHSVPEPPMASVETLVDAGYLLYDAGYWTAVGSLPLAPEGDRDHPVSVAAEFFAALSARRTVGVDRALELFSKLPGRVSGLGRHQRSVELEAAYLKELGGDYASARREFRELEGRIDRFDATSRVHVRSRLYLADMETMDGDLETGARRLLETYESELLSQADWAELVRHRGHALRFSFLFDAAVDLYLAAMRTATELGLPALRAKLWTNLAEARCWADPALALEAADASTELNQRLGNRIELAKCEAARAIALAKQGRFGEAGDAVMEAQRQADAVGYPAGIAFALQAKAIALGLAKDAPGAEAARLELKGALDALGTYPHLAVAPLCLAGDDAEFERRTARFGWQEPDGVTARIRRHLTL